MTTIVTKSGARKEIPEGIELERIIGLDEEGRIVIFDEWMSCPFGLTLCCNAFDKGMEDGVGCRGCYGFQDEWVPDSTDRRGNFVPAHYADAGSNLFFKNQDGSWAGLDALDHFENITVAALNSYQEA